MKSIHILSRALFCAVAAVAVFVDSTAAPCRIGVCAHVTRDEFARRGAIFEKCAEAGIDYVRADFDWHVCRKSPDSPWDFSRYDTVVDEAATKGITILPILYGVPKWAKPLESHMDGWREFVRETSRHFKGRIPVYEIWNEQNNAEFWRNPNPTNYLPVLRAAFEEIKGVDPSARVLLGGFMGVPLDYIGELYRLGGGCFFDVMNVHPYSHPFAPDIPHPQWGTTLKSRLDALRALMAANGDAAKPVWITEIGWPVKNRILPDAEILLAGLAVARPDQGMWRVAYASTDACEYRPSRETEKMLLEALPQGSTVATIVPENLASALELGGFDAVAYPFNEDYPADTVDAVAAFVANGGVLIECGGMAMWKPYRKSADGAMRIDKGVRAESDRAKLRIGVSAHWLDAALPARAVARIRGSTNEYEVTRFFTEKYMKPGDELVPILSCVDAKGRAAVAAGVYRFNSDMKGAVVVSSCNRFDEIADEMQSAEFLRRSVEIAFACEVERFFPYEFADDRPSGGFGLFDAGLRPRSAWKTLRKFTKDYMEAKQLKWTDGRLR